MYFFVESDIFPYSSVKIKGKKQIKQGIYTKFLSENADEQDEL